MAPAPAVIELRCERHLHGRVVGDAIEVKCGWCSKVAGRPVYHRWRLTVGTAGQVILSRAA